MASIRRDVLHIRGYAIQKPSAYPSLRNSLIHKITTQVDEDDELFIGYGLMPNPMPFTMQDNYALEESELEFPSVILENEYLEAVFLPTLGGRIWSLYDKVEKRDLVTRNPVFKPGNFAVRNAWVAGGIEWNIGRRGHDARTSSPLFAAQLSLPDGTPVLRLYEFCRDRAATYQMDFFLPEGERFLFARMRIVNPNEYTVPMYHFSNTAVTECEDMRIVTPAHTTFANTYVNDSQHALTKLPLPFSEGFDATRPTNFWSCKDHFFNIPVENRKFEAAIYADGYGLIQCSTDRLRGRKLFVWGQCAGGRHWQRRLTSPEAPDYLEIQAGLGRTQMECLPMPPKTAWEWLEAYGAIHTEPGRIFGDWDTAVNTVEAELEKALPRQRLDQMLAETRETLAKQPGKLLFRGSGWGALDRELRKHTGAPQLPDYLDFVSCDEENADFLKLLRTGSFGEKDPGEAPSGYMIQDEWFELIRKAAHGADAGNYYTLYHLALNYYCRNDFERAESLLEKSLALRKSRWALHALANVYRMTGRMRKGAAIFRELSLEYADDLSLLKEAFKNFSEAGAYDDAKEVYRQLPEESKVPLVRFFYAEALAHTGDLAGAEAILLANGGIVIPDIREGENSTSAVYVYIQQEKARREGRILKEEEIGIPFSMDLRMTVPIPENRQKPEISKFI